MVKVRKQLNKTHLIDQIWEEFNDIPRPCNNSPYLVTDHLMSALALLVLKYPSLRQFDIATRGGDEGETVEHRRTRNNLKEMRHINRVPSDSGLRRFLDLIDPEAIRPVYARLFAIRQRTGVLRKQFGWQEGYYLVSLDGTGVHSSKTIQCPHCCTTEHEDGTITYGHQMMGGALVHPDHSEVIPLAPEPIIKEDGQKKNDGECNAIQRMLDRYRQDHPRLKLVVLADSLHSNASVIQRVIDNGMSFIMVAKLGNHDHLFGQFYELDETNRTERLEIRDRDGVTHSYLWKNDLQMNKTNDDIRVNFLFYQTFQQDGTVTTWTWVTDRQINAATAPEIARAGRSRWQIENTFNTLKNRGYRLEHNFGHGEQFLTTVFQFLMILALLVDQLELVGCQLFQKARDRLGSLQELWVEMRVMFKKFRLKGWQHLYESIYYGVRDVVPEAAKPT